MLLREITTTTTEELPSFISSTPTFREDRYYVAPYTYSTGDTVYIIVDRETGLRANPSSSLNTLYDDEEYAQRVTDDLNAGGDGHIHTKLGEKQVWARRGKQVVRKYRCTMGPRKNRIVAKISQCFAAPDIKKRATLKRTKAKMGARLVRKSKRTKRINPASKRVQALNKMGKRKK